MAAITTRDGTTVFYKERGKGRPIVFSHGKVYAGAAHALAATERDRFNADLLEFVES